MKYFFSRSKKMTIIAMAIVIVYGFFSYTAKPTTPALAKQFMTILPGTFESSWENGLQLISKTDLPETAVLDDFSQKNSAYPLIEPILLFPEVPLQIPIELPTTISVTSTFVGTSTLPVEPVITSSTTSTVPVTPSPATNTTNTTATTSTISRLLKQLIGFLTSPVLANSDDATTTPKKIEIVSTTTTLSIPTPSSIISTSTISTSTPLSPSTSTQKEQAEKKEKKEPDQLTQQVPIKKTIEQSSIIISGFSLNTSTPANTSSTLILKNTKLLLSFANDIVPGHEIVLSYRTKKQWHTLATIKLDIPHSNQENQGYFSYPLEKISAIQALQELEIKISHFGPTKAPAGARIFLDSAWIETNLEELTDGTMFASEKKNFSLQDDVSFVFEYKNQPPVTIGEKIKSFFQGADKNGNQYDVQSAIYNEKGEKMDNLETSVTYLENNLFSVSVDKQVKKIRPGAYILAVDVYTPQGVTEYQQLFTWGLLAMNSNKATYRAHDTAYLQMAVLKEDGHTVCDANLSLVVVSPSGQEAKPEIKKSGLCGPNNVIDVPDYFVYYPIQEMGKHALILLNRDTGAELYDSFDVVEAPAFDIERIGPTRIFPPADYTMSVSITVNQAISGTVRELVPYDFVIKQASLSPKNSPGNPIPLSIINDGGDTRIEAHVNWLAGETYELRYTFDAPNVSPYLFLLGPFTIQSEKKNPSITPTTSSQKKQIGSFDGKFTEIRKWQIASDAIGTIDPNGDGNVNCTPTPNVGTHAENIDDAIRAPATADTSNYITCGNDISTSFAMSTLTAASTTTKIDVFAYHKNNNAEMQWEVELWNTAETTQYGTTQTMTNTTTVSWGSVAFSSLTMSQGDLNGLRVKFKNKKTGAGSADNSLLYAFYAEATFTPSSTFPNVTGVSVNGGSTITLSENTTTTVSVTSTVSDGNGYADISTITAKLYRAGVTNADACSVDDNNCYSTTCTTSNCSGNSCTANCNFPVQFHADPTDAGTPWASDFWRAWVQATDSTSQSAGAFSAMYGPDIASLIALDITTSTNYGSFSVGGKIDPLTVTTTITATGNNSLDITLYGANMTSGGNSIDVGQQRYSLTSSTVFASGTVLVVDPGVRVQLNVPKTTSSSTLQTKNIWWGIEIPNGTRGGTYTGTITSVGAQNELSWP